MKHTFVFVLIFLSACATHPDKFKPAAEIKTEGDTIFYIGNITANEVLNLIRKARRSETPITTLQIKSGGGDVDAGIEFGLWLHENNLNVVIDTICFSSCANYIFTAAKTVTVKSGAVIGWHGGAFQKSSFAHFNWYDYFNPSWVNNVKQYTESMKAYLQTIETDFFNTVGVDQQITTYGQIETSTCRSKKMATGWHYQLSDLKRMGIKNIVLEDGKFNSSSKSTYVTSCEMPLIFDT